jgi:hypothetical protein
MKAGRPVIVACPFDLIAGLDGLYIWNRIGYRAGSTHKLARNILAWRIAALKQAAPSTDGAHP